MPQNLQARELALAHSRNSSSSNVTWRSVPAARAERLPSFWRELVTMLRHAWQV